MTNDLEPCPFCGGRAEMGIKSGDYGYTPDIYYVRCERCSAKVEMVSYNYKDLSNVVVNAWNKRVKDDNSV